VRSVTVSGNPTKAWPVRWHHYGTGNPADDERFFFSADGHELVRIEWGPRYGNCISERCDRETALSGLPGNLSTVIPRQPGGATGR
jgi:hypothetical protein